MDCKLRYTADVPPHAHGVALCCCWVLGCSRIAALYDNSCLFVARSQISVLAVVTTLLTSHINLACHNARHNSDLIGAGSTCKTNSLRLKVKICPYLLDGCHKIRSLVHHTMSCFFQLFVRAFTSKIVNTLIKNSSRDNGP